MIVFLTSSPSGPLGEPNDGRFLDGKNGFVDNLKQYWKHQMRGLIISADPDGYESNDEMRDFFTDAFAHSQVPVTGFDLWDHRCAISGTEPGMLTGYDVILLGGGHVPTQNAYFHEIHLREQMRGFAGMVIGISAGTMNSADVVYAQPELPGESLDPEYRRYLQGLGLTELMVLPHFQMVRDFILDGRRLIEDITFSDSYSRQFFALTDGSYIRIAQGESRLYGRGYRIADGQMTQICEDGASICL